MYYICGHMPACHAGAVSFGKADVDVDVDAVCFPCIDVALFLLLYFYSTGFVIIIVRK
jgi:hypothetical protein